MAWAISRSWTRAVWLRSQPLRQLANDLPNSKGCPAAMEFISPPMDTSTWPHVSVSVWNRSPADRQSLQSKKLTFGGDSAVGVDPLFLEPPARTAGATGIPGVTGTLCGVALGDALGAGPRAAGRGVSIRTESGENIELNFSNLKHIICTVSYVYCIILFVNWSRIGAVTAGYHLHIFYRYVNFYVRRAAQCFPCRLFMYIKCEKLNKRIKEKKNSVHRSVEHYLCIVYNTGGSLQTWIKKTMQHQFVM
jgi:hypothetical protein